MNDQKLLGYTTAITLLQTQKLLGIEMTLEEAIKFLNDNLKNII